MIAKILFTMMFLGFNYLYYRNMSLLSSWMKLVILLLVYTLLMILPSKFELEDVAIGKFILVLCIGIVGFAFVEFQNLNFIKKLKKGLGVPLEIILVMVSILQLIIIWMLNPY